MTRNAKTGSVVAIAAAVLLTLAWVDLIRGWTRTIARSDGPRRTIDIGDSDLIRQYGELAGKLGTE